MSLEEKRVFLTKKREKFESAMIMGAMFLMLGGSVVVSNFNDTVKAIICIASFTLGYLAGYYLPIRKWFNSSK